MSHKYILNKILLVGGISKTCIKVFYERITDEKMNIFLNVDLVDGDGENDDDDDEEKRDCQE
jgi:hypothetical protein